jgi:hypothetical protein
MRRRSSALLRLAVPALLMVPVCLTTRATASAASEDATPQDVMQSVFGNRVRDGGFWRQDNQEFKDGVDVPRYWMQVWRNGPGGEVVIVDAYEVRANSACSALMHIVYTYDQATGHIESHAFGANGISGHGVAEFKGTVTTNEATIRLPGGREVKMRDREDHGAAEAVVVEAETWDGKTWKPGKPATWRRSTQGLPCEAADGEKDRDP